MTKHGQGILKSSGGESKRNVRSADLHNIPNFMHEYVFITNKLIITKMCYQKKREFITNKLIIMI